MAVDTKNNNVAIRKRTMIARTNKMMFLWIAAASVIVGAALVVGYFMAERTIYHEKVLAEKQKTVDILKKNSATIPEIEKQVRVLDTNTNLMSARANENDQAVRVILDALPSDSNTLALGASLQKKLIETIPGLSLDSIQIDSNETGNIGEVIEVTPVEGAPAAAASAITFTVKVSGTQSEIRLLLEAFERSIRQIDIINLRIESSESGQSMTIQAQAYYEPARVLELHNKEVPR